MSITVQHVGGNPSTSTSPITSDSWTSVAGSTIVVIVPVYNPSQLVAGDVTDSKGNTYVLRESIVPGVSHANIGVWENVAGTRGASHTVTYTSSGGSASANIAEIELTATGALAYDSTTAATASTATSPFNVTAAGAVSGIAIYGLCINCSGSGVFTDPSGYTDISSQNDGNSDLVSMASYKNGESGTPTVGGTSAAFTISDACEVFVSYKEATSAATGTQPDYSNFPKFLLVR